MGYILTFIVAAIVLVVVLAVATRAGRRPVGQVNRGADLTPKQPASETVEPAKSDTAPARVVRKADQHTPAG